MFSGLMVGAVGVDAMDFVLALAVPTIAVAIGLFSMRRVALIAGVVVGVAQTLFWTIVAIGGVKSDNSALGTSVVVFPLLAAAATLLAIAGLSRWSREARLDAGAHVTLPDAD